MEKATDNFKEGHKQNEEKWSVFSSFLILKVMKLTVRNARWKRYQL